MTMTPTTPSPSTAPMKIDVRGVKKSFSSNGNHVQALERIDIEVKEGEFVCLVGPSGCGKSTLLNLIGGHERADTGEILVDGRPVHEPGPDRMLIFQEPGLFPWLSVRRNVEFVLEEQGMPRSGRKERVQKLLKMMHLSHFAESYPHELSGGMRQRVALARALAPDPRVLLMDEPFAALDAQTRDRLHLELQDIWLTTGKTILFVTHNVREAVRLGDRVLIFSARPGRILREVHVTVARPRQADGKNLNHFIQIILRDLRAEVEKVAQQEMGIDYEPPKDRLPVPSDRDVGRGI